MQQNRKYLAPEVEVLNVSGGYLMQLADSLGAGEPQQGGAPFRNPDVD